MDSHGRHLDETLYQTCKFKTVCFQVLFRPGATTHQFKCIEGVPRRWMGEGTYIIIHLGSNNLYNRDGTEKENSKTVIENIISTCQQAKQLSPNVIYSSILPQRGEIHGDAVRC